MPSTKKKPVEGVDTPRSHNAGTIEVGLDEGSLEVVINLKLTETDKDGNAHLTFSPTQARNLADILYRKSNDADAEYTRRKFLRP